MNIIIYVIIILIIILLITGYKDFNPKFDVNTETGDILLWYNHPFDKQIRIYKKIYNGKKRT